MNDRLDDPDDVEYVFKRVKLQINLSDFIVDKIIEKSKNDWANVVFNELAKFTLKELEEINKNREHLEMSTVTLNDFKLNLN